MDFKNLDEYKQYWTEKLYNGDYLNHSSAELMLDAVKDAKTLEEAETKIGEAVKLANSIVLNVWSLDWAILRGKVTK